MGIFSNDESSCYDCKYQKIYEKIKEVLKDEFLKDYLQEVENEKHELMIRSIELSCENSLLKQKIEQLKNKNNNLQFESTNDL